MKHKKLKTTYLIAGICLAMFTFHACTSNEPDCVEDLVTPISSWAKIGDQRWNKANYNVPKFRNDERIRRVNSLVEWNNACDSGQPVWCYPDFRCDIGVKFGKLFNYYAVRDPRNIAPKGWRLPTVADYRQLASYVGAYPGNLRLIKNVNIDDTTIGPILRDFYVNSCLYGTPYRDHRNILNSTYFSALLPGEIVEVPGDSVNVSFGAPGQMTTFWTANDSMSGSNAFPYIVELTCDTLRVTNRGSKRGFYFLRLHKE
ncbi:MAG: fibrobacter succinogenes major paralogous domain-containing protein [Bacteroidetes bacterium]|nr:fibrobacter succinogenes major paralogous domain-containing protein [Bacteroidota bacterium]